MSTLGNFVIKVRMGPALFVLPVLYSLVHRRRETRLPVR